MSTSRTYEDPCGVARALDRIGERWALLVVRELLLGPRRFTDLKRAISHASPNVLSHRLAELQAAGVVATRELPPPAAVTVYELTPWGAELRPVIMSLAAWGSRALPLPSGDLSITSLVLALETTFAPDEDLRARIALTVDGEPLTARVDRKRLSITRDHEGDADASIVTTARALRAAAFRITPVRDLRKTGDLALEGDLAIATRFLGLFRRPTPAVP